MKFTLPKVDISFLKPVVKSVEKHAPEIMIGIGVAGLIGDIFMTAKIAPKADRKLKKAEFQKGEPLTKTEAVKEVGRDFVPIILIALISTLSIVCGARDMQKRTAAMAAMYTIAETALADYKNQVVEVVGEEKEKEITKKADERRAEKIYESEKHDYQVIDPYSSLQPFYDLYRGKPFYGKQVDIDRTVNFLQKRINEHCQVSVNDFYYELGHDPVSFGDSIGWSEYTDPIDIRYGSILKDGISRITINFKYPPTDRF